MAYQVLVVYPQRCTGCRLCEQWCSWKHHGAVADGGYPLLCDLCGGDPQCVKHCPEGALMYLEPDKLDRGYREFHAARIAGGAR